MGAGVKTKPDAYVGAYVGLEQKEEIQSQMGVYMLKDFVKRYRLSIKLDLLNREENTDGLNVGIAVKI